MPRTRGSARGARATRGRQRTRSLKASMNEGRQNPRGREAFVEEGRRQEEEQDPLEEVGRREQRDVRVARWERTRSRTTPVVGRSAPVEERNALAVEERNAPATEAFMKAMTDMLGTLQRGATGSSSIFDMFMRTNPPMFEGSYNPTVAQEWIHALEKTFKAIRCPEEEKVNLAAYQLRGRADSWWQTTGRSHENEEVSWEMFKDLFYGKYFPESLRNKKEAEFIQLEQGGMGVGQYEMKFTELSRFAPKLVDSDRERAKRFRMGLRAEISIPLAAQSLASYAETVDRALMVEAEVEKGKASMRTNRERSGGFTSNKRPAPSPQQGSSPPQESSFVNKRPNADNRGKAPLPTCERCGKQHPGECYWITRACFGCGKQGHQVKDCPQQKKAPTAPYRDQPRAPTTGRVFNLATLVAGVDDVGTGDKT